MAPSVPPVGPAIDDAQTAHSLTRVRWIGLTVGVVGACVLAMSVGGIATNRTSSETLLANGRRTEGTVVAYAPGIRLGLGEMTVRYTADGRIREGVIQGLENAYRPGQELTVVYDARDPSRIRTPEERNESFWGGVARIVGTILGALLLLGALILVRRAVVWPRVLGVSPWHAYSMVRPKTSSGNIELALRGDGEEDGTLLELRLGATLRARGAKLRREQVIWVAGTPGSAVVVARPGGRDLYAARLLPQHPKSLRLQH